MPGWFGYRSGLKFTDLDADTRKALRTIVGELIQPELDARRTSAIEVTNQHVA